MILDDMIFIKINMIMIQQSREFDVKLKIMKVRSRVNTKIMLKIFFDRVNVFMSIKQVTQQLFQIIEFNQFVMKRRVFFSIR